MTNLAQYAEVRLATVVARLNIEHYRKKRTEEVDETRRQTLLQLIAEEDAELAILVGDAGRCRRWQVSGLEN
jgi:succinate dehydrogenase flavin-adding protein (antitoxin of CptAB toxin-antitoxin module)